MIKLVRAFAASCLLSLVLTAAPLHAASVKTVYIVQLAGAPLARSAAEGASVEGRHKPDFTSAESLRALERLRLQQEEAIAAIRDTLHRRVEPLSRYSVAFQGIALEMNEKEAAAVARLPGVKRVQLSARYHVSSDAGPAWIGAPGLWNGTATGGLPGTPVARLTVATFWVSHYQLTVLKGGTGSGLVTSNPAGINCGADCSEPTGR